MPTLEDLPRSSSGPVAIGAAVSRANSISGLLIDTMELVEPVTEKPVPNHLLETKVYTKLAQNAVVHARPASIHFEGFEINKKHIQKLTIVNAASEVIRMHIIPPQTKYFYVRYKKPDRMVPGLTLECTVEFTPDEWRYYYDCIRINCPGEENLLIPIHAYPVMATKDFPQMFTFPPTAVGHNSYKIFPLRSNIPIDFEFQLTYITQHPSFNIDPMSGIVPANGETRIKVTFSPAEFQTAMVKVQLLISQFNTRPIICCFYGSSSPGLLRDKTNKQKTLETVLDEVLDPRCISPLDRARSKKSAKKEQKPKQTPQKELEYEGVKFAADLNTPYAVAQVLNQEPGKLRAKDLRETVLRKKDSDQPSNRQMKEAVFEHAVRQNVYEERQNQLRWQVRLGEDQISGKSRARVLENRKLAWDEYKYQKRGDPIPEQEYQRLSLSRTFKRTIRDSDKLGKDSAQFDLHANDKWERRHVSLQKFIQAVRQVIVRNRAEFKLKSLRKAVIDWSKKKYAVESLMTDVQDKLEEDEEEEENKENVPDNLSAGKISKYKFPLYVPPNMKDDMAPDALGCVPVKPTEVFVKRKVPYFGLKVPQQGKILGYKPHTVHEAASGYVPPKLVRPLRTGAEDEVIRLPEPASEVSSVIVDLEDDLQESAAPREATSVAFQPLALMPPEALFSPIEYPALHIFNPAPGLQVFQSPMPYAEVDGDFHLCPLPRYTCKDHASNPHSSTQRRYLDREDVIRGIMSWKKFPSQGLTSLSNTPTLTSVWVPRWDDPFGTELLPHSVPPLFDELSEEDRQNVEEEEEESHLALTPEMVSVHFAMLDKSVSVEDQKVSSSDFFPLGSRMPATNIPVGPSGPVPREKREEELEYFMTRRYNRLGNRISTRIQGLNSLATDANLVLK